MRSRNQRSCEITSTLPANSSSASSSARRVSTSRSLDGSSSSSTLPPLSSVAARCSRPRSPPDSVADDLLLVAALEVEAAQVGARRHLEAADGQDVLTVGDRLPHGLVVGQRLARLVDDRELRGVADRDLAGVGLLLAGDHAEQRRLAGAVGTDDARRSRPAGRRNDRLSISSLSPIAPCSRPSNSITCVAQALGDGDEDLLRLVALLVFVGRRAPRSARCAPCSSPAVPSRLERTHSSSFCIALMRAPSCLASVCEAVLLLLEPGAVVALPRNAVAAVELEDPLGGVVEEVAIVGDRDDGSGKLLRGTARASRRFRRRGGWWARRAAACRASTAAGGTARRGASRRRTACRSSRPTAAGAARRRRSPSARSESAPDAAMIASSRACSAASCVEVGVRLGIGGVDLVELGPWPRALRPCPPRRPRAPSARGRAAAPAAGSRCAGPASAPPRLRTRGPRPP